MPNPFISSDPNAGMRSYYESVASREGFTQLAIPIQFAALLDAIAVDYRAKAAWLRESADLSSGHPPRRRHGGSWRMAAGDGFATLRGGNKTA